MANIRFPSNGSGTFSDNLVGNQNTDGNQFTQNNFSTEGTPIVRDTRNFTTSEFSKPITLDDLTNDDTLKQVKELFNQSLKIKFNTEKGSKDLFGSAFLRAKVAVENIANKFPASLYVNSKTKDAVTVDTAYDVVYNGQYNTTIFKIPLNAIRNPLSIEYTTNGLTYFNEEFDVDRNLSKNFEKYVLFYGNKEYKIKKVVLPNNSFNGIITLTVEGNPFNGQPTKDSFYIKLNSILFEKKFELMDDFEQFLLNRETSPLYKSKFRVPKETSDGKLYFGDEEIQWKTSDDFNIIVEGPTFESYLEKLFETCEVIDNYKANLIARFLTTASLHEFDTEDQKVKKVFQLYGRFFDDVKKFIDNIAYMNNVTYDKINNIPDLLLKNLAGLLGLDVITSINEKNIEEYLYKKKDSQFDGMSKGKTPFETDIEIYRRIILNAAYLYKSKGTRKPIRFLMNFIGAPESFIEINEYVYKVINRIDYDIFKEKLDTVIDGTWFESEIQWNGTEYEIVQVSKEGGVFSPGDYPISRVGDTNNTIPSRPNINNEYFFQKGAGWFERTDDHRSLNVIDEDNSDFTVNPKIIKTKFEDFTYGEKYYDRYRQFPNFTDGWEIKSIVDNKKSSSEENPFILNRKNIDVFLNPGQAVLYDFVRTYQQHTLSYSGILLNNFNFAQFAEYGFWYGVKVGEGKYGKKYWDLINIFKEYYNSGLGKAYDYEKTYAYLNKISTYWIRLVEQFIPATTLWFVGEKVDNHSLHRNKFNWNEPCRNDVISLDLTLEKTPYELLIDALKKYKNIPDCYERMYKYANWYIQVKINDEIYTLDYDGWNHFFTSTESNVMGSCNNPNNGPGNVDTCELYDNPIYMLCDFENHITCYPKECENFITSVVNILNQISVNIFNNKILPNIGVEDCGFVDELPINGRAFEIEGFIGGENCYDCKNKIKLVSNRYCEECFEIDNIEIGLKIVVNDGEDICSHKCFVLSDIPFSIDYSQFGGIQYDINRPEHQIDPLDHRGTVFLSRIFEVVDCCNGDRLYHGTFQYIGLMDPVDRFPVYKHITEDIYLSAYPSSPESTIGSFMFTQGPKESYTEIYGRIDDVNLLDFTNVFTHNQEWLIDNCITISDIEQDRDVVRHRYAIGDEIGICDRIVDDGFDYIKLWLHGGTFEAQDGTKLPYDVIFDCYELLEDGEQIWYDEYGDFYVIRVKSGIHRLIHAYDQSGAPIHILLKDRYTVLNSIDFEKGIEYGGYGNYGEYGYYCYGNEYVFYTNINPYCVGVLDYQLLPECQGYEEDTEVYKVVNPVNSPINNIDDVIMGVNVVTTRVQDILPGDYIVTTAPKIGEIEFCDYSEFYYGNKNVVCKYTEYVSMTQIVDTYCGRIYKYVNINEGEIKLEHNLYVLTLVDLDKSNSEDLLHNCFDAAPVKPIGVIKDVNGVKVYTIYDNRYGVISKKVSDLEIGDYIIQNDECGVVEVKMISFEDYCESNLYVNKFNLKREFTDNHIWYKPKDGYISLYVDDQCVPYCELITCPETTTTTTEN